MLTTFIRHEQFQECEERVEKHLSEHAKVVKKSQKPIAWPILQLGILGTLVTNDVHHRLRLHT